jgi:predicted glycosyltransferase
MKLIIPSLEENNISSYLLREKNSILHGKRIAIYTHDTLGLGHMRRNLLIANTLAQEPLNSSVLMISGSHLINNFTKPDSVDFLTLPSVKKSKCGNYSPRFLDLSLGEITTTRSGIISSAMEGFQPDVFIVDGVPRGLNSELDATLKLLRDKDSTYCILGLRDILDDPDKIKKEWAQRKNEEAIRENFDSIWIYGDREVYDSVKEYEFSDQLAEKINFTGYLDRRTSLNGNDTKTHSTLFNEFNTATEPFVLCMAGGGEDGAHLLETFSEAKLPKGTHGIILTGPYLPSSIKNKLHSDVEKYPYKHILEFHPEPLQLLRQAKSVIAMGGYNTVSEIISFNKKALIVPRVTPRVEQLMRAQVFSDLGLVDLCRPSELTSSFINEWLKSDALFPPHPDTPVNLKGLENIQRHLMEYFSMEQVSLI